MEKKLEMARAGMTLLWVVGAAAAILAGLDAVPGLLAGEPRGVRRLGSIEEAERSLGARLILPAYFPDAVRWPPRSVRLLPGSPAIVALVFATASGNDLLLFQSVGGPGPIPERLLDAGAVLAVRSVALRGGEAALSRVLAEDGTVWNQISWVEDGRRLAMRSRDPEELVIRMARSARREGP